MEDAVQCDRRLHVQGQGMREEGNKGRRESGKGKGETAKRAAAHTNHDHLPPAPRVSSPHSERMKTVRCH